MTSVPSRAERAKIKEYQDVALSDRDLLYLLDGKANIVLYPDLAEMTSLDEVLGESGAAIILYCSKPSYGHWCALIRGVGDDYGKVEFFNPYGGFPDDSLELLDPQWARRSKQDEPKLSLLMIDSPYELSYNQYPFQAYGRGIKTCGRHCASRVLLRHLPLDAYAAAIYGEAEKTRTTPDAVVSAFTSEIAPKPKPILKGRRH